MTLTDFSSFCAKTLGRLAYRVVSQERRTILSNDLIFKVFSLFPQHCKRVNAYPSLSSRAPFLTPRDVCY